MTPGRLRARLRRLLPVTLLAFGMHCTSPAAPSVPSPASIEVISVTPDRGTTFGGTPIRIVGQRFAPGAGVFIGGRPARDVTVESESVIVASTPLAMGPGAVDVTVSVGSTIETIPGAFTYVLEPMVQNGPPTITALAAQGTRANEPSAFADLGETLAVTVTVVDAETDVSALDFEWTACGGGFAGSGPSVTWRAPLAATVPRMCRLTVTVVETFPDANEDGLPIQRTHRVTASVDVRLHDSATEIEDLALLFLNEFSDSDIPAETTVRNFSDACGGKAAELDDVRLNRALLRIEAHQFGAVSVDVGFGGVCQFRSRSADACVSVPAEWRSRFLTTGEVDIARGVARLTAVYEASRWRLCDSEWDPATPFDAGFMR